MGDQKLDTVFLLLEVFIIPLSEIAMERNAFLGLLKFY